MRIVNGDVNIYWLHDTLTPHNIRGVDYGTSNNSATLLPDAGDVVRNFCGLDGAPITVRVVSVVEFGQGCTAYEVCVTTVEDGDREPEAA